MGRLPSPGGDDAFPRRVETATIKLIGYCKGGQLPTGVDVRDFAGDEVGSRACR